MSAGTGSGGGPRTRPASAAAARLTRRDCLAAAALALVAPSVRGQAPPPAQPMTERGRAAIDALLAGRTPRDGRVQVEIPKLAENGLSVPLTVRVDSPMTVEDHVRTLHLIAPVNPIPTVARIHLGPRAGEAYLRTRVRLADTQELLAFAEMSDGSVWRGRGHVVVTLGGCLDPVL